MKTIILPDLHTGFARAEAIINDEKPDNIIFIGDYFDAFGDSLNETLQIAEWLKKSLTEPNRIHLLGNHDLTYLNTEFHCSGFTQDKLTIIKSTNIDLTKLQHYCWIGDWLCTHSGLSNEFFNAYKTKNQNVNDFLQELSTDQEGKKRLYDASPYRGGQHAFAGILWCDYEEFIDIPNLKQIFGHTHGDEVRHIHNEDGSEHYCIDTGLKNYGVYDSDNNLMIIAEAQNY